MSQSAEQLEELKRLTEILANRPTGGLATDGEMIRETIEAYVAATRPRAILVLLTQLAEAQRQVGLLVEHGRVATERESVLVRELRIARDHILRNHDPSSWSEYLAEIDRALRAAGALEP